MKDIREFLSQLSKEMQHGEDFDIEARQLLEEIHKDVDQIEGPGDTAIEPAVDRVKALEASFASKHPTLERIARELADALAKMGI